VIINILKEMKIPIIETKISVEDFMQADEIWITNTTKGVLLVSEIDEIKLLDSNNIYQKVLNKFIEETLA
jgi:branched-subunit amino acid aminotransferase/4-amino-4-deoxychorismate lyase